MSVENPAVPLSSIGDGDDNYDTLTGGPTAAGVRVTAKKALGLSAIWRGVNLIAGHVGRYPFRVYRYSGEGLQADRNHQSWRVVRRPNDFMTPFTFRQTLQAHALLEGNGYAYIVRDLEGVRPVDLLPLDPGRTWPVRVNGELWYLYEASDGPLPGRRRKRDWVKIPATEVLHIKGLGFDGLVGYPVRKILADTIGGAVAARDYGSKFFQNNARPGIALQVPAGFPEKAVPNLRESWEKLHRGLSNAHKTAILREGVTLAVYDTSAKTAQLVENRSFDARELANILGVPPHKLGDPSRTAYNSLESENQAYEQDTLGTWFAAWEQECDCKLLTESEKETESHCFRFDPNPLARVPIAQRGAYYVQGITTGWLSRDEVRGFENLPPLPGGAGRGFDRPVNVAPIEAPPAPEPEPTPDPEPADPAPETEV